jgi:GlcNAc-P-P-Und epimerase
MKILILGGSGFIGSRLAPLLLSAGHQVTIGDLSQPTGHNAQWVKADVTDPASLVAACQGMDVVINLAAVHRDDVRPLSLYDKVNVEGAANVCKACDAAGVKRIIFTSSVAIYGVPQGEADESAPVNPFNDYGRTKWEAEKVFTPWANADPSKSLVIIRPTVVFGEGNRGNVYNLLKQACSRKFFMVGSGTNQKSMAYVQNIAGFLAFCVSMPTGIHIYNYVDKPDYNMNDLVARIMTHQGRPAKPLRIPYFIAWMLAATCDIVAFITRKNLPFSRVRLMKFCANTRFASNKMRATGYKPPFTLDEALNRTLDAEFPSK